MRSAHPGSIGVPAAPRESSLAGHGRLRSPLARTLAAALAALVLLGSARAADDDGADTDARAGTAEDEAPVRAIVGATVFPVARPMMRRGTVVWEGDEIVAVGSEIDVPEGAEVIDGEGLYVTPGLVALATVGVGFRRREGDIEHSLDPWDRELRLCLAHGITAVHAIDTPGGSGFGQDRPVRAGARSAVVKLAHGSLEDMLLREPAANFFSLPDRQIELNTWILRDRFRRAAEWLREAEASRKEEKKPPKLERELRDIVEILRNERPTVIAPSDVNQVRFALELRDTYGFDLVLSEPDDAWPMAPELARREVAVMVKARGPDFDFDLSGPVLEEGDMVPVRRPHAFARAGVVVGILPYRRAVNLTGLAGRGLTSLALDAAYAVRGGLSEEEALRAVTLDAARILGVDDRIGSLEPGKDADLLLLAGHPLDFRTHVLRAWVSGEVRYDRESSRIFDRIPFRRPRGASLPETPDEATRPAGR